MRSRESRRSEVGVIHMRGRSQKTSGYAARRRAGSQNRFKPTVLSLDCRPKSNKFYHPFVGGLAARRIWKEITFGKRRAIDYPFNASFLNMRQSLAGVPPCGRWRSGEAFNFTDPNRFVQTRFGPCIVRARSVLRAVVCSP